MSGLALALLLALPVSAQGDAFERGVDAYRRGDQESATLLWSTVLTDELAGEDRARVLYNLGNAAWRNGDGTQAVAWYTACLRHAPRHSDAWANLEFARSELGIEPADRGDLPSSARRLLGSTTARESGWLVLGASLLFGLALAGEALRGGRLWRALSLAGLFLVLGTVAPWIHGELQAEGDPYIVVGQPTVTLRSEPRTDLPAIAVLDPGETVDRIDALPDWIRVTTSKGERGWAPAESMFSLLR